MCEVRYPKETEGGTHREGRDETMVSGGTQSVDGEDRKKTTTEEGNRDVGEPPSSVRISSIIVHTYNENSKYYKSVY